MRHLKKKWRKACGDGGRSNKDKSDITGFLRNMRRKEEGRENRRKGDA